MRGEKTQQGGGIEPPSELRRKSNRNTPTAPFFFSALLYCTFILLAVLSVLHLTPIL